MKCVAILHCGERQVQCNIPCDKESLLGDGQFSFHKPMLGVPTVYDSALLSADFCTVCGAVRSMQAS